MTSLLKRMIIIGRTRPDRANMTSTLIDGCTKLGIPFTRVDGNMGDFVGMKGEGTVAVMVSSPERYPKILAGCEMCSIPLVVATSNVPLQDGVTVPVISAPNLSLLSCATFDALPRLGTLIQSLGGQCFSAEIHQDSKKGKSPTAERIAGMFGVKPENVGSVRSNSSAAVFSDVPPEHLSGFARIGVVAKLHGMTFKMMLESNGRESYLPGLLAIIEKFLQNQDKFGPGIWQADQMMFGDIK